MLFDRNLPFKITNEELYEIFGKYGDIRQIRMYALYFYMFCLFHRGDTKETRGTAFVVYEDIYDAKDAVEHLSGFNVGGRYLVVLYFQATRFAFYFQITVRANKTADPEKREKEIEELKAKYGLAK